MLEGLVAPNITLEQLLVLSGVLTLLTIGLMYAIPSFVRTVRMRIDALTTIPIDEEDRPVRIGTVVAQRLLQALVLTVAIVILLLIWDQRSLLVQSYELLSTIFPTLSRVAATGLLLLGAYFALSSVKRWVEQTTGQARRFNKHDQEIIKRIVQLLILLTIALLVLMIWSIDVSGLLVGAGVLGIILGYAARDTLGSIVAGLVLMFSRPFEIGDWIVVGDDRGIVTDITIVNTRIRSPEGEHIIIPNTEITHRTIRNRSYEPRVRFSVDIGVDFDTDLERAQDVALEAVKELDIVADSPFPSALVDHLEDSSIVIRVRFWVDRANTEKQWLSEHQVLQAITKAFRREGIHIPYPHQRFISDEKPGDTQHPMRDK